MARGHKFIHHRIAKIKGKHSKWST
ncbi:hypothetical protein NPIL_394051, partial [Nephila pilipes]